MDNIQMRKDLAYQRLDTLLSMVETQPNAESAWQSIVRDEGIREFYPEVELQAPKEYMSNSGKAKVYVRDMAFYAGLAILTVKVFQSCN
jgi:peptidyl-tRNA hydrolase